MKYYASAHLSAFFFGMTGILGNLIVSSAYHIVFYRSLIACIVFFFLARIFSGMSFYISSKNLKRQMVAGLLIAGHWLTFFMSAKMAGAALAAVSYATFPFFLTYLEPLYLHQKPDPKKIMCSIALIAGVALISPEFSLNNNTFIGILYGVVSGFLFAVTSLLYKKRKTGEPGWTLLFWQMLFSALVSFPFIVFSPLPAVPFDWFWLVVLGSLCTLGAHGLFIYSLHRISAQIAGMIVSLEGVYGTVFAILLLDEKMTVGLVAGAVLITGISIGIGFYDRADVRRRVN